MHQPDNTLWKSLMMLRPVNPERSVRMEAMLGCGSTPHRPVLISGFRPARDHACPAARAHDSACSATPSGSAIAPIARAYCQCEPMVGIFEGDLKAAAGRGLLQASGEKGCWSNAAWRHAGFSTKQ